MDRIPVALTEAEGLRGGLVGVQRRLDTILNGRVSTGGEPPDGWGAHIDGGLYELAAAKGTGVRWPGRTDWESRKLADLHPRPWDVRGAARGRRLLVRPDDPDERVAILVWGAFPGYEVVGWMANGEAKQRGTLVDPANRGEPCYLVDVDALHPMDRIPW